MNRPSTLAIVAVVAALGTTTANAHHSFAAFDRSRAVTLSGVVKEVQWNNPHTWIQLIVTDANGKQTEWGLECGSPNMMARTGWRSNTLKTGDKVVAVANPLKDGRPNGALVRITLPDGRVLGPGDAPKPLPLGQK